MNYTSIYFVRFHVFVLMYSLPQSYKLYWNIVLCFFTVGNSCKELNVFNETFVLISV